jgi:hypothetical protein
MKKFNAHMKFLVILIAATMTLILSGQATAQLTAILNHDHISIDFFYHGSSVSVRAYQTLTRTWS